MREVRLWVVRNVSFVGGPAPKREKFHPGRLLRWHGQDSVSHVFYRSGLQELLQPPQSASCTFLEKAAKSVSVSHQKKNEKKSPVGFIMRIGGPYR